MLDAITLGKTVFILQYTSNSLNVSEFKTDMFVNLSESNSWFIFLFGNNKTQRYLSTLKLTL